MSPEPSETESVHCAKCRQHQDEIYTLQAKLEDREKQIDCLEATLTEFQTGFRLYVEGSFRRSGRSSAQSSCTGEIESESCVSENPALKFSELLLTPSVYLCASPLTPPDAHVQTETMHFQRASCGRAAGDRLHRLNDRLQNITRIITENNRSPLVPHMHT